MKLNIALCDDDPNDLMTLERCLYMVCMKTATATQTTVFSNAEDFLTTHKKQPFDIAFIDIYLSGIDGTKAVHNARQYGHCQFIFTTSSQEHAIEAFALNAVHYLLKPVTEMGVQEAINRCLPRLSAKSARLLELKTNHGVVPIPEESIIYIEVRNKICTIHTQKNHFKTYTSLDALFERLDNRLFMRAQRSYIVNMKFIDSFFFDHVVLQEETEIVLSRNGRPELKKQYQQFLFNLARKGDL